MGYASSLPRAAVRGGSQAGSVRHLNKCSALPGEGFVVDNNQKPRDFTSAGDPRQPRTCVCLALTTCRQVSRDAGRACGPNRDSDSTVKPADDSKGSDSVAAVGGSQFVRFMNFHIDRVDTSQIRRGFSQHAFLRTFNVQLQECDAAVGQIG